MKPVLYIVIPCYNEEPVLPETSGRIGDKLHRMIKADLVADESRIIFVDDGSRDKTWELIRSYHQADKHFGGLKLAHNRGQQGALLAGLLSVNGRCDAVVSMDADLQDDIEVLDQFVEKYRAGAEVVYGVRKSRATDTFFKRESAQAYYRVMAKLGTNLVYNHAEYRLLGSRALEALAEYREVNLFLRGIVPDIGYKTDTVYYERAERFAGESKYPLRKMISFALEGITSFSARPLQVIFPIGLILTVISVLALLYALLAVILNGPLAPVFALGGALFLCCGLLMQAMGILAIYISKIYSEVKQRPRFRIEEEIIE